MNKMKTIGLIGGMSWESSDLYYQQINRKIQQQYGGFYSAKVILNSVNFHDIELLQRENRWDEAGQYLAEVAQNLERAGVDVIALCTNTMHKVAKHIEDSINVPFIHITEATIHVMHSQKIKKVALLGTAFTMEQDFYKTKIIQSGIEVIIPNADDRQIIHEVIYQELCQGVVHSKSKHAYLDIIDKMIEQGAQGVILGCTEIGMLIQQSDLPICVFDTTQIHVDALIEFALT